MSRDYYVYIHRRETDGRVFYVGKGRNGRYKQTYGRNLYWQRVAAKHGWVSEKLYCNLAEACAHSIEKMLIHSMRAELVNMTDGGEGVSGLVHTDETRQRMSAKWVGRVMDWNCRPVISSDGRVFPSIAEASRIISREIGKAASFGNISSAARGEANNAYGLSWSYDTSKTPAFKPTKYRDRPIRCTTTGEVFPSISEAVEQFRANGIKAHVSHISRVARGERESAPRGYKWEFVE